VQENVSVISLLK